MPRIARVVVPGLPHHIIQRGNNREDSFVNRSADITIIQRNLGQTGGHLTQRDGDFNLDHVINSADMTIAQNNLGANKFTPIKCFPICPPPQQIPSGKHCVSRCPGVGGTVLLHINVWVECYEMVCIQPWFILEICGPDPSTQPVADPTEPIELSLCDDPLLTCDWYVIEGDHRIHILEPGVTNTNVFRFLALAGGPVTVKAVHTVCIDYLIFEDEISFNIAFSADDLDGDGLNDDCEEQIGSDPEDFYDPPPGQDADSDGLTNVVECDLGTHPSLPDSDGDGLWDGWEIENGLNPSSDDTDGDNILDGYEDEDMDGFNNLFEQTLESDPDVPDPPAQDSDLDGVSDDCENALGSNPYNPFDPDVNADTDNDGVTDVYEVCVFGTNPNYYDSDSDGLPDGWEIAAGSSPLDADTDNDSVLDWAEDNDGDGMNNIDEWIYGTSPGNPDTDADGTSDGDEANQGSNPSDPSDEGQIDPNDVVTISITIGDPSGSESERWMLKVGYTGLAAPGYGTVITATRMIKAGGAYDVTVVHLGSNCREPDYDYTADVQVIDGCGFVDDPDDLLGSFNTGGGCGSPAGPNPAANKSALLDLFGGRVVGPTYLGVNSPASFTVGTSDFYLDCRMTLNQGV